MNAGYINNTKVLYSIFFLFTPKAQTEAQHGERDRILNPHREKRSTIGRFANRSSVCALIEHSYNSFVVCFIRFPSHLVCRTVCHFIVLGENQNHDHFSKSGFSTEFNNLTTELICFDIFDAVYNICIYRCYVHYCTGKYLTFQFVPLQNKFSTYYYLLHFLLK